MPREADHGNEVCPKRPAKKGWFRTKPRRHCFHPVKTFDEPDPRHNGATKREMEMATCCWCGETSTVPTYFVSSQ
jgi:hypothetical protein